MKKSFFRKMIEEKGLIDVSMVVKVKGFDNHYTSVENVIEFIENSPQDTQDKIRNTMSLIDYKDGDLMDYIYYIAQGMVMFYC